ncbi:MAG: histidinol-phosphate transaminase [Oscillospiraceae bacterium]|nr:histidinol-phosphate transaminase [Oscillospiraceae bacterium]
MSWRDNLIKIEPYVAGEQPNKTDFIKLNANENPYPPAPGVLKAIERFNAEGLKKYPDADAKPLAAAIAKRVGLERENVFVGNGSDDVLALCFRAFFNSDKPVIYPDITYSFYPVWCEMLRIPFETIPVDGDFSINAEDYKRPNGGVVIANPNAPTSIARGLDFIREILDANKDSVVIVDEAYVDFGGESAVPLLSEYENLVVTQTFSKSRSMAGMRIGCAFGNKEIISALYAAKDSYNSYPMDSIAIEAGVASVEDEEYFLATLKKVIATRDRLTAELREMGFSLPDSSTNFVFAEHEKYRAKDICEFLKTKDIYVRYFSKPRIDNRLRITIGTDEEIDALIAALKEYIG